jgi:hypothetical protein
LVCAKGLYKQGINLLDPREDDYSILSGCILLEIGLEKLIKSVLAKRNPLMIIEKVNFEDIRKADSGEQIIYKKTINLETALDRLGLLYPELSLQCHPIKEIIKDRNHLVHGAGYFDIARIEGRVRMNIAELSESICKYCLNDEPSNIFAEETWNAMANYRDAYKRAEVLELNKRIAFLKRVHCSEEVLPCDAFELPAKSDKVIYECPICGNKAEIMIDWDIDVDHRDGDITGAWPFLGLFRCNSCKFSLSNSHEIETLVGGKEAAARLIYSSWQLQDLEAILG